jgi:hypothetical protein
MVWPPVASLPFYCRFIAMNAWTPVACHAEVLAVARALCIGGSSLLAIAAADSAVQCTKTVENS